ncbi:MAG: DEAD/DEAH box helicase [Gemmatales bacterium]|nr:DEAD/DEAH box helicase [Gemmatales bacterium]MDW7994059.1 DEAD/DEAH box helicase [Gemmatales bacterium]
MPPDVLSRDAIYERFLEQLPFDLYPVQEEALLAWFASEQGVLVCAPTGMGKTVIAHAALFEALHNGTTAYYTTPLIALTEQKFDELRCLAEKWGFSPDDVGLVTGNRRVNPQARILVVVAEILLNRLLQPRGFDFSHVSAVVMDEFHNFNDPERGIVWELTLALLPKQVRLLLLSATVGNAPEFLNWLHRCHGRQLELVQSQERRVPLTYQYVPDQFLTEQIQWMAQGSPETRKTPALVFCFNREECWTIAEQLKGLPLLDEETRRRVNAEVDKLDWKHGVGPKLKQMLRRGVGVHHAGLLPKYRRVVGELFERKLLAVVVCTETLSAGINLPARSVVLSTLVKGPPGKQKLIDPSTAHQIFGRAGRPQYDTQGYVFALAHEDDVRIHRWREKYEAIPEDTKDPILLKLKKELKRKKPSRRENQVYWSEGDFHRLRNSPPGKLASKGQLPWRLLAYMLKISPEIDPVRQMVRKRLLPPHQISAAEKTLDIMLRVLHRAGFVRLEPEPPSEEQANSEYVPIAAQATDKLDTLLLFRSIHPLYGAYLLDMLGIADRRERLQALESVLEIPTSLRRKVRVPGPDKLPPGPLAITRLDPELIRRGLMAAPIPENGEDDDDDEPVDWEPEERPPVLADKLRLLFQELYPEVNDLKIVPVWSAGELLEMGGDFNKYIAARDLAKQEGIIFRHLLRLILLCGEFADARPTEGDPQAWHEEMVDIAARLTASCRAVDPTSTDQFVEEAQAADVVEGETAREHPHALAEAIAVATQASEILFTPEDTTRIWASQARPFGGGLEPSN